jgi:hypothetical protein
MRLFSIKDLVCVAVVFLLMPSLNCQRIKSIPTLFEPTHPPLVRLASEDYPVFSDTVDRLSMPSEEKAYPLKLSG